MVRALERAPPPLPPRRMPRGLFPDQPTRAGWSTGGRICCLAVVRFDLEAGQSLECMQPNEACFPPKVLKSLRYLAFPDSNSGLTGDYSYVFRFRNAVAKRRQQLAQATAAYAAASASPAVPPLASPSASTHTDDMADDGDMEPDTWGSAAREPSGPEYCQCQDHPATLEPAPASNRLSFGVCPRCQLLRNDAPGSPSPGASQAPAAPTRDCGYRAAGEPGGPKFLYGYVYFR
jgi:hypothetical protein